MPGDSTPVISLVIPIYNVASYIEDAMHSVYGQLPPDCEVVCVDDGSTDASIERLKAVMAEYASAEAQTCLVTRDNGGLSLARNTGIEAARGRYIGFLDPDDCLCDGYFDTLKARVDENPDVSIVCFNAIRFGDIGASAEAGRAVLNVHPGASDIRPGSASGDDALAACFARGRWFAWARLYARSLFDIERFTPGMKYQDMMLLPRLYAGAQRILNIETVLVAYRVHEASVTARPSQTTLTDLDRIIARYDAMSAESPAPGKALRELVILSAMESYYHAAKKMHGRHKAVRVFRRRQTTYGARRLMAAWWRQRAKQSRESAALHISPWLHLALAGARRRLPSRSTQ